MAKKYRSEAYAAIRETMDSLHAVAAIDKQAMREFDDAYFCKRSHSPNQKSMVCALFF